MSNLYVTTFGSAWTGGYSINSIAQGEDGWTYLAGGKSAGQNNVNLVVLAYQDGVLKWEKEFGGPKTAEEFRSVYVQGGYVYAAGGIRDGFASATHDNQIFPNSKPSNTAEPDLNCAPFFVKLDAENGDLELARVLPTTYAGNSVASGIAVDEFENIYVNSGITITSGEQETNLYKFNSAGTVVWKMSPLVPREDGAQLVGTGGNIIFDGEGNLYTLAGYQLAKITYENHVLGTYYPIVPEFATDYGIYLQHFVVDSKGDAYFVAFESSSSSSWSAGTTVVTKVKNLHNTYLAPEEDNFIWERRFEGASNGPGSICFDGDGNLLIAGQTNGDLNGVKSKGLFDGYLVTIDPSTGAINNTTIIGTEKNEWLNQAIVRANGDILLAGDFSSKYYSIENTPYKNIFLITKEGFTVVGNALNNEIQGGEGNDKISGGVGNDKLSGGKGNDILNGGANDDSVNYSSVSSKLAINLATGVATGNGTDTLISIEDVIGGRGNDRITGNNSSNEITSGAGDDTVDAGGGNDLIVGGDGAGNDTYNGGKGIDTVKYTSAAAAITVDLLKGTAISTADKDAAKIGTDTLIGIENVIAGKYNDIVKGSTVSNVLTGGLGSDRLYGGVDKLRDVFDFNSITESKVGTARDKVYNFIKGIDDIDLRTIDANSSKAGNQDFGFSTIQTAAKDGTVAKANSVWWRKADVDSDKIKDDIIVYCDVNGDTKADFEIGLVGVTSIAASDFVL
jgi:Ca2+-binding RTX toxin-like protein